MNIMDYINLIQSIVQDESLQFEEIITYINQANAEIRNKKVIPTFLLTTELSTTIADYYSEDGSTQELDPVKIDLATYGNVQFFRTVTLYYACSLIQETLYEEQKAAINQDKALRFLNEMLFHYDQDLQKNTSFGVVVDFEDVETELSNFLNGTNI